MCGSRNSVVESGVGSGIVRLLLFAAGNCYPKVPSVSEAASPLLHFCCQLP